MAKIHEEIIIIKFSKITRDADTDPGSSLSDDSILALVQVAQELVGSSVVVEVERA